MPVIYGIRWAYVRNCRGGAMARLGPHIVLMPPPLTISAGETAGVLAAADKGFVAA